VNEWLDGARHRLAATAGDALPELSPAAVEQLLELARIAAHESGERTNAPLVSYLVGVAHGRTPDARLDELIAAAIGQSRDD
jgi:hypothetical protein